MSFIQNQNLKKYLLVGSGIALAGAALYYLSVDGEQIEFKAEEHTIEKLRAIVHEICVMGIQTYQQDYQILVKRKQADDLDSDVVKNLQTKTIRAIEEIEQRVYNNPEYGYNEQFVTEWIERFRDDKVINAELQKLENVCAQVFKLSKDGKWIGSMPQIHCSNKPFKTVDGKEVYIKEEDYIQIYRKQMAKFRHEIYKVVKGTDPRGNPELQAQQKAEFDKIMKQKPKFMEDALALYEFKRAEGDSRNLTTLMEEVYLELQTKSLQPKAIGGAFNLRIQVEQKEHNQILEKMIQGEPMPQLDTDPMLNKEADLATDMRGLTGFIKKSKTIISEDKDRVKIGKRTDELVHKFIRNLRQNVKNKKLERKRDDILDVELEDQIEQANQQKRDEKEAFKEENTGAVVIGRGKTEIPMEKQEEPAETEAEPAQAEEKPTETTEADNEKLAEPEAATPSFAKVEEAPADPKPEAKSEVAAEQIPKDCIN